MLQVRLSDWPETRPVPREETTGDRTEEEKKEQRNQRMFIKKSLFNPVVLNLTKPYNNNNTNYYNNARAQRELC